MWTAHGAAVDRRRGTLIDDVPPVHHLAFCTTCRTARITNSGCYSWMSCPLTVANANFQSHPHVARAAAPVGHIPTMPRRRSAAHRHESPAWAADHHIH